MNVPQTKTKVKPNFQLKPGQEYMTVETFKQMEELFNWLTNADLGMRSESIQGNFVFIDENGSLSEFNEDLNVAIQEIALANHRKNMLLSTISK